MRSRPPRFLVSVRSASEVDAALEGGAQLIDLKEPDLGPLGRAEVAVWQAVLDRVPPWVPVSAALGELHEFEPAAGSIPAAAWRRLTYVKLGLSAAPADWADRWAALRTRLGPGPRWIAVVYADHEAASAPPPAAIIEAGIAARCAGILVDTWKKGHSSPLDPSWSVLLEPARRAGLLVALAGGLDAPDLPRLAALAPDIVAVRGAACERGDRLAGIDPSRVAALSDAVSRMTRPSA